MRWSVTQIESQLATNLHAEEDDEIQVDTRRGPERAQVSKQVMQCQLVAHQCDLIVRCQVGLSHCSTHMLVRSNILPNGLGNSDGREGVYQLEWKHDRCSENSNDDELNIAPVACQNEWREWLLTAPLPVVRLSKELVLPTDHDTLEHRPYKERANISTRNA